MNWRISDLLSADCGYMYGENWNLQDQDIQKAMPAIRLAVNDVETIRRDGKGPTGELVLFPHLPYILSEDLLMDEKERQQLAKLEASATSIDVVVSIGIGGSYLGNKALFDAFCGPYWNMGLASERQLPQVFFAGQNADPESLSALIRYLEGKAKTTEKQLNIVLLVISKSGSTIEPMSAFYALYPRLSAICHVEVITITDKQHGLLLSQSQEKHWMHFSVPEGIGGRFSVLSQVGIVFCALCGIDYQEMIQGAKECDQACQGKDWKENPALALALFRYLATVSRGVTAEVVMPYGDRLNSFGRWYAQLMAESLGKAKNRQGETIHYGRTLVPSLGTTDMHSMTQEHQEGPNNKLIQFITVQNMDTSMPVHCQEGNITGTVDIGRIMKTAQRANAEALASEQRMSCHIALPAVTPRTMGGLFYFFMLTVAYEGGLAGINAFDQPGVETYKKIMHSYLKGYMSGK